MSVQNELDLSFAAAQREGRAVLLPYLTAGYPDPAQFVNLAEAALESGADAFEIGIPFSDPLLDGPAIQRSQQQALDAGVRPEDCLRYAAEIRTRIDKPLLFMGAYNPILAYGPDRFSRDAAAAGVSALIIPDLPFEEQDELRDATKACNLHLIQLVAPTSTPERLRRVCAAATGFVYCISVAGVTGERSDVTEQARPLVEAVRQCSNVPVVVGFGISGREQAQRIVEFADGVAIGSAFVNLVARATENERLAIVRDFISDMRRALEARAVTSPSTTIPRANS
jgi:tryptophan synthase alpha chain